MAGLSRRGVMEEEFASLSERELEVLKLVATGATNQQVARELIISPNTVKVHLRNIYEKLGVQSRTEATMEAVRRGWVCVDGAEASLAGGNGAEEAVPIPEAAPAETAAPQPPIALWQRIYMFAAGLLVILALLAPGWWQGRSMAAQITPFTDSALPAVAPPPRPEVRRWVARAPLPEGRSRLALAADRDKLYAIGGETASGVTAATTIYDPASNGWLPGTDKPTAVANAGAATVGGLVYVPGGMTASGVVTDVLEVYDPASDGWHTAAPLPQPLAAYGLAVLDERLYLFGGWDGKDYQASTYVYDPEADVWSNATPMDAPRGFLAASALEGVIYVVGGFDGRRELDKVEVYDPVADEKGEASWTRRASLNQARGGLGLLTVGSRLYAIGGGWDAALAFNEQYDITTGAWSRIESPVLGQWRNLGLVVQDDKIYAIGGWSGGSYLSVNEEYQALFRLMLPQTSKSP